MVVKVQIFVVFILLTLCRCGDGKILSKAQAEPSQLNPTAVDSIPESPIVVGAAQLEKYLPLLEDKEVALLVNQTSQIGEKHLVDKLLSAGVDVKKIFAPEHGFRGEADAGAKIKDGRDPQSGLPIISLYGKKKAPNQEDLAGVEVLIFDIQDVGARFYTYISTLHYLMQSAADFNIPMIVLDRPNPNGHYVDGPVLNPAFQSFVGMHPVAMVHGMTVGEYAQMINGEEWLSDGKKVDLNVITCQNYQHNRPYELPIRPSPNLPNQRSIYLYPWLCLFEATQASVGRGTDLQFQIYGAPGFQDGPYQFRPEPKPGARYPKHEGQLCQGFDLSQLSTDSLFAISKLDLSYLIDFYKAYPAKEDFFTNPSFFDKLAGTDQLRKQLIEGATENEIRASWEPKLQEFKMIREKYLLYE